VTTTIRALVMGKPALPLLELLEGLPTGTPDDVYFLIATEQLYVDLSQTPLADPQHVSVFVDREQAAAYTALSQATWHLFPGSSISSLIPGTRKRQNSAEDLAGRSLLGYACGEQPSQPSSEGVPHELPILCFNRHQRTNQANLAGLSDVLLLSVQAHLQ
jgi:hypothetical protein